MSYLQSYLDRIRNRGKNNFSSTKFLKGFHTDVVFHPAGISLRRLGVNACGDEPVAEEAVPLVNFLGNFTAYIGQMEKVIFVHCEKAAVPQSRHGMAHAWL